MKNVLSAIALALMVPALFSCKTTEANYKAAYDKTVAARDSVAQVENTIYGSRRQMQSATVATDSGTVEVRRMRVKVTEGGGALPEQLRRFNVVAAQFKQRFNALSMRGRLADGTCPGAFVVETAEPYYYVVAASYADAADAAEYMERLRAEAPVVMREPCPFILDATANRSRIR